MILNDKKYDLFPVNPFDPKHILNKNHSEVSAMIDIISAFRSNSETEFNTNPYLRQLAVKGNIQRFRELNVEWNEHTSPWEYYEPFRDKYLEIKIAATVVISVIAATMLILAIVYALDNLNII